MTWSQFLHSQAAVACDFFTVDTVSLKWIYVLFFIHIPTRQVLYAGATANPAGAWTTQATRNLFLIVSSDSPVSSNVPLWRPLA